MKRILRVGEGYALSKIYSSLLAAATIMCLYAVKQVSAQETEPATTAVANANPLQIGDTIPEYLWHLPLQVVNHPRAGGKDTITLNDYRDKLIILDFWATWCKPCISSLYKLDTLQKQFTDEIAVIPATYEAKEKAGTFIANKGWSLPSAVGDTILKKYFPHQSIPHQVWIKSGRVEAIAGSEYANKQTITSLLSGRKVDFEHKNEVYFNKGLPLFLNGNGGDGSNLLYQSVISGRLNARVSGVTRASPNQILAYNQTVEELYALALQSETAAYFGPLTYERYALYEVDDTLRYRISPRMAASTNDDSIKGQWVRDNWYCYNLVLPSGNSEEDVNSRMLQDLNAFFGDYLNLRVSFEHRDVTALAIVKRADYQDISTKGGVSKFNWDAARNEMRITNRNMNTLVRHIGMALNDRGKKGLPRYPYPIVNETGIAGNVDLVLNADFLDIDSVRRTLHTYGLDLVEKVTGVKMIVYSHKKSTKSN